MPSLGQMKVVEVNSHPTSLTLFLSALPQGCPHRPVDRLP